MSLLSVNVGMFISLQNKLLLNLERIYLSKMCKKRIYHEVNIIISINLLVRDSLVIYITILMFNDDYVIFLSRI